MRQGAPLPLDTRAPATETETVTAATDADSATDGEAVGPVATGGFVELDAGRLGLSPQTVIRLEGRDGERLEVERGTGMTVDVAALVDAFWRRRG
jgi:hypothetical protein